MRQHRSHDPGHDSWMSANGPAPGKRTRSEQLAPVQQREREGGAVGAPDHAAPAAADYLLYPEPPAANDEHDHRPPVSFVDSLLAESAPGAGAAPGAVQRAATANGSDAGPGDVHAAAATGIAGPAGALPFADVIQRSFGAHDLSAIQAHVGGPAAAASAAMGAEAYATGQHVAFARPPDLHTAAHEAAHVVQQRAGVQLQGGVGEVGDAYEQQADAVADAVVRGESAEHLLGAAGGVAAGSAEPDVQRKAGGAAGAEEAPELVAPRLIEFDDLELGDRQRGETTLWNPGPAEVVLTKAELVLDRNQQQFQVREAPTRLVPTSNSAAARMGRLVLDFVPQGEGLRTDTLRLTVRRHGASGGERTIAIALAGRARAPGQPTHAEKVARERGEQAQRDEEAATAGREKARDARIERNMEDPRPAPAGRAEPFRARLDDMRDDVREIDAKRIEGINIIEREAETYRRRQPPLTPSAWDFVRDGAILALSFASAGLARNVAALLVPVGGHKPGPLGLGVGVADDNSRASGGSPSASRQLVQKAVEKALGKGMEAAIRNQTSNRPAAAAAGSDASSEHALSSDPTIAFFAAQRIALGDSRRDRLADLTALGPELVDMLHDENEFRAVLAILDEARAGLGTVKGKDATELQSLATAAQWIAFVAKRDGETKAAPTGPRGQEAAGPRADQVTDLRPLDGRDGVIEIGFTADLAEPGVPVRIVGVRLFGVSRNTARRIRQMELVTAGVPVRAVARRLTYAGQAIAEPSIAVARNEVGEIEVAAGRPGPLPATNREARYLAAKHAPERQRHAREADVRAGARHLVETEIAGQRSELAKMTVETDDDAKR